jgi:hypothetical protein
MSRMPCSITDDPYNDASDYYEDEGVYKSKPEPNPDDQYDDWVFKKMMNDLEPLITPFEGDKRDR